MINYSIIVPYYNKYELFLKALDSIPDREDVQVIIVDNAPQSLTNEQIPVKQKALVCYAQSSSQKGAGCARNEGLKHVEGRYLLFLDSDDYYTPDAFSSFDKYLDSNYDIVFFKPTSIYLADGSVSNRHTNYSSVIDEYYANHDESRLRYRWEVPWSKMFRSEFVINNGFCFDETRVSNDAWFSLITGHNAKVIAADNNIVYVVTEGGSGQSLVMTVTKENIFIRYKIAVKINKFLKSVGHYDLRIRLLGFLHIALSKFGLREMLNYLKYAIDNKVGIF